MDKDQLLQQLSLKVYNGEISRDEVLRRLNLVSPQQPADNAPEKKSFHFSVTKTLYALGAIIVIIGVVIMVAQIWEDIGAFGRILVTLGLGLLLTGVGSLLSKQRPQEHIGPVFHFIGGMLIPGGAIVALNELELTNFDSIAPFTFTFAMLFVLYIILTLVHRHAVLTLFALIHATVTVYLLISDMIIDTLPYQSIDNVYAYLTMLTGLSYIVLGYAFKDGWNKQLTRLLYFAGSAGFSIAAFLQIFNSIGWQFLYLIAIIAGFFLAAFLRSTGVLAVSTLSLISFIVYITAEYFANSVGWPLSLVVLGFIIVGLGYASLAINRKYIKA